jgi:hypothetical protein
MSLIHFLTSTVQCHPSSAGLSRCVVVSQLGSKSSVRQWLKVSLLRSLLQIAAATSAMVVLVVILWVGKHLYSLPKVSTSLRTRCNVTLVCAVSDHHSRTANDVPSSSRTASALAHFQSGLCKHSLKDGTD